MPTMRGLGLMKSRRLALDIRTQTSGEQDLPRFGALVELIPVRPACLISYYSMDLVTMGVPMNSLDGISPKTRLLGFGVCVRFERDLGFLPRPLYRRSGPEVHTKSVQLGISFPSRRCRIRVLQVLLHLGPVPMVRHPSSWALCSSLRWAFFGPLLSQQR